MHHHDLKPWRHGHDFREDRSRAERNTRIVMVLTAVTMVAEIVAGSVFGSMALLADGWHMATHVAAFGITIAAYRYERRHAADPRFSFGTGKVGVLGGYTSAVALGVVAALMAMESLERFVLPQAIRFDEAIAVAAIGLLVNVISALLLRDHDDHAHAHVHGSGHAHEHDQNLRAAYVHVLADALTSVLAIVALTAGKVLGWIWLDALTGLVGAAVIAKWAWGLLRDTGVILLDGSVSGSIRRAVTEALESDRDTRVSDLHVWHITPSRLAAAIALVTHDPQDPGYYRTLLQDIPSLVHVTVEVNPCRDPACGAAAARPRARAASGPGRA
ncbi:CDF family Co(II)/Ni(II) efflux transporter DmeF [Cyanobium sp. CH-040]|uniref:CDF family Co(II)/Ni(II) efflux transporter DmeF n=1 Tax=Cyanobium sp. CH-040 TaxID=2823708 RepID=UPI0020CF8BC2|nr:CDF family Co(II)/Ni(II) efflux transporter DmeF [Cyanobium sp. CH-040]MCP9928373.1 CDF family Co(II)/Ni(II) efflux transporter DmeF [Cyanobium sp. CH-040]